MSKMKILILTDVDDYDIDFMKESLSKIEMDLIITLGDIPTIILRTLEDLFVGTTRIGVLGNHDSYGDLEKYTFEDINNINYYFKGIRFLGLQGCLPYNDNENNVFQTENDYIKILANNSTNVDILVSHSNPYIENKDDSHKGVKAYNYFLEHNHIPLLLHGHLHEKNNYFLHKTHVYSFFECSYIELDTNLKEITYIKDIPLKGKNSIDN